MIISILSIVLGICIFIVPLWAYRKIAKQLKPTKQVYTGWRFLVTYTNGNRDPWFLIIGEGSSLKGWIKGQRKYGFDVDIVATTGGTELRVDTHDLAGWERREAK